MGSDVEQIFLTASLHRDHSISYALVCEKEISHTRGRIFNQGRGLPIHDFFNIYIISVSGWVLTYFAPCYCLEHTI